MLENQQETEALSSVSLKDLGPANDHRSLEVDPAPVESSDENLVDNLIATL